MIYYHMLIGQNCNLYIKALFYKAFMYFGSKNLTNYICSFFRAKELDSLLIVIQAKKHRNFKITIDKVGV